MGLLVLCLSSHHIPKDSLGCLKFMANAPKQGTAGGTHGAEKLHILRNAVLRLQSRTADSRLSVGAQVSRSGHTKPRSLEMGTQSWGLPCVTHLRLLGQHCWMCCWFRAHDVKVAELLFMKESLKVMKSWRSEVILLSAVLRLWTVSDQPFECLPS